MDPKHVYLLVSSLFAISFGQASSGRSAKEVAADLEERYHDDAEECTNDKGEEKPAYQCSGIMIRGVNNVRKLPYPWSMKPFNREKQSFAMAYLRHDAQWSGLPFGYDAGFIMYPQLRTPSGKKICKAYCAFPLDAWTDNREGKHACGKNKAATEGESHHCEDQGINTFAQWRKHFERVGKKHFSGNQCGFDMTKTSSTEAFRTFLKATKFLEKIRFRGKPKFKDPNNEILVKSWDENKPEYIPIEAFFYVKGTTGKGKNFAQKYQKLFQKKTGEKMPIVGIQFPDRKKNKPFKVLPF